MIFEDLLICMDFKILWSLGIYVLYSQVHFLVSGTVLKCWVHSTVLLLNPPGMFCDCFISALACGLRQLEVYTRQHKVVPPWALALPREGHTRGAAHSVMSTWFWAFPCLRWNGLEQHLKSLLLLGFFCTYWSVLLLGCHLALLFHLPSLSSEESVTKWDSHCLLVPFTGQICKCTFLRERSFLECIWSFIVDIRGYRKKLKVLRDIMNWPFQLSGCTAELSMTVTLPGRTALPQPPVVVSSVWSGSLSCCIQSHLRSSFWDVRI